MLRWRFRSQEELRIADETLKLADSLSLVARRHDVNAELLFN